MGVSSGEGMRFSSCQSNVAARARFQSRSQQTDRRHPLTRASCAQLPSAREVRQRQRKDTHVLGSDWNLSSAPPLSEGTNDNAAIRFANDSGKDPGLVLL